MRIICWLLALLVSGAVSACAPTAGNTGAGSLTEELRRDMPGGSQTFDQFTGNDVPLPGELRLRIVADRAGNPTSCKFMGFDFDQGTPRPISRRSAIVDAPFDLFGLQVINSRGEQLPVFARNERFGRFVVPIPADGIIRVVFSAQKVEEMIELGRDGGRFNPTYTMQFATARRRLSNRFQFVDQTLRRVLRGDIEFDAIVTKEFFGC